MQSERQIPERGTPFCRWSHVDSRAGALVATRWRSYLHFQESTRNDGWKVRWTGYQRSNRICLQQRRMVPQETMTARKTLGEQYVIKDPLMIHKALKYILVTALCAIFFGLGALFRTEPSKNPITREMIASAEKLTGLSFGDVKRDSPLDGLKEQLDNYQNIRK